jgi:hypothetical protein
VLWSRPKPDVPTFSVAAEADDVVSAIGVRGYQPNWEFSYHYQGEVLNQADITWANVSGVDDVDWWQTHVRGWVRNDLDHVELAAHWEPAPTEHPVAHLRGTGFDRERAMESLVSSDSTDEETEFLGELVFGAIPHRVNSIVRGPSVPKLLQFFTLFLLTGLVGIGYLYGVVNW